MLGRKNRLKCHLKFSIDDDGKDAGEDEDGDGKVSLLHCLSRLQEGVVLGGRVLVVAMDGFAISLQRFPFCINDHVSIVSTDKGCVVPFSMLHHLEAHNLRKLGSFPFIDLVSIMLCLEAFVGGASKKLLPYSLTLNLLHDAWAPLFVGHVG